MERKVKEKERRRETTATMWWYIEGINIYAKSLVHMCANIRERGTARDSSLA